MTLDHYRLGERRLRNLASETQQIMNQFEESALSCTEMEPGAMKVNLEAVKKIAKKIEQRGQHISRLTASPTTAKTKGQTPAACRRSTKRRTFLTVDDRIELVRRALVGMEPHKMLA